MKTIFEPEKAAIFYGIFNDLSNTAIYIICHPGCNTETASGMASAWIKSRRIKPYYDSIKALYEKMKMTGDRGPNTEGISKDGASIDFTNKSEFIKYLNQAANRIQDDKLKNDILKMLSDHLDFKDENKRDESNQIQRFYLPLRCQNCAIYQKVSENSEL